jgi:hypothetical protein
MRPTPGVHAIILLDQAGWHGAEALKVPSNIWLLLLPPCSELNGQENVWQFMRQTGRADLRHPALRLASP